MTRIVQEIITLNVIYVLKFRKRYQHPRSAHQMYKSTLQ